MPGAMQVRLAVPADGPRLLALVRELAEFERLEPPSEGAQARLLDDLFGPTPRIEALVAERDGAIAGYAAIYETYSTFRGMPVLWLEDLYVTPSARRGGIATRLLREVADIALDRGCARVGFVVLRWNVDAQRLYEKLGAERQDDWIPYALGTSALEKLARP